MIEQNSIENLKNRLDIVEVIGSYIELKKSGANFKARCPFHGENTPSFVVSPSKQIYHCFGCGAGGDAIKFVMEYEKLSYPEALEKLANDFNITLSYTKNNQKKDETKILKQINLFYKRNLTNNQQAKSYLLQRGIYESSIEKFEIGYAPTSFTTIDFLKTNFLPEQDAIKCGLLGQGENGRIYARFIERITFPIFTPTAKIVGFGGRTITNHPAKYINSPQTPFFNKSKLLYGYHLAKDTILRNGRIIVTEGYLDVIMLHQAGFKEAVATLGTALTKEHLPLLRRGEPKVILSYDGDTAGIEAAIKASKMLGSLFIDGGVVVFDGGKDPADMVKNGEINKLAKLFENPKPFIPFVIEMIAKKYNLSNPIEKEKALKDEIDFLKTIPIMLQDEYRSYISALLDIDKRLLKIRYSNKTVKFQTEDEDIAELSIIKSIISNPNLIDMVLDMTDEDIFKKHKEAFRAIVQNRIDDSFVSGLMIRDDISILNEEDMKSQLCMLLGKHYRLSLNNIKNRNDLSFEKKSFYIRQIQDRLQRLKKGVLVRYEKF